MVDHAGGKVLRTLIELSEPQGVGYEPTTDTVYVSNAGDGSIRILRGGDLSAVGRVDLGDDADNVRVDAGRNRVLIGYGAGALAVFDPATRAKIADVRLTAHPESFQIDGDRAFVNVPDARLIEVRTPVRRDAQALVYARAQGRPGVEIASLFHDRREEVRVERWQPNASVVLDVPGGGEFLVLDGGFDECGEGFASQSWLRLPPRGRLCAIAGKDGCTLWVKTGHLRHIQIPPRT